ncbi:MAG TPA: NADH-quinone oxidoreductase subunit N [Actinomycetota bacterium]|jgi:NADH-quinone oxidoreductase subunit N|nr:NADH-quinone oxidoreductase subunit N [Actinomycetota bacterium]
MLFDFDLHALSPEIILTLAACFVLVADLFLPDEAKWLAMPFSAAGVIGALAAVVSLWGTDTTTLSETYAVDTFALVFKGLLCLIALIVLAISLHYFRAARFYQGEYYFLMLCSLLGTFVIASSRDLIGTFIAIELISTPAFVMAGLRKRDAKSNEAALKFFLFGVLSSAVMLYGMSLVYGFTGETNLGAINDALSGRADEPVVVLGVLFLIVGFAFKISAVPFHFWAPDTYEGAPSPVAAFLSTASKIGGFIGLLVLMFVAFPDVADAWRPAFAVLAALTMTVGNLIALSQRHIIRLLAYSGIAQSGYILVCFALVDPGNVEVTRQAFQAAIIYLAIYGLMDAGAFAAAVAYARRGGTYFIDDYSGLWSRNPALAVMLAGFLVSLAGTPPMAGMWAKLFVFLAALRAESYWLAIVMGVNAVIAAWYYLAVVKRMFFEAPDPDTADRPVEVPYVMRAAMGAATLALVAAFVFPPLITELAERSTWF